MPRVTKKSIDGILSNNMDLLTQAIDSLSTTPQLPPICEFVESDQYLNLELPLYPPQRALLKLMFLEKENMNDYEINLISQWAEQFSEEQTVRLGVSPDVWKRVDWCKSHGYNHFREIVNITGRRGGKGYLGAIMAAYIGYRLLKLGDPHEHYGIESNKDLYCYTTATNFDQAVKNQFADIAGMIIGSKCFRQYLDQGSGETTLYLRTPSDVLKIADLEAHGIRLNRRIASVRYEAVPSTAASTRGIACFAAIFDEFAHMQSTAGGPRTAEELYNALTPAINQFKEDAFIYIPTSPWTKIGKCYALYEQALQRSGGEPLYPNTLALQLTSWDTYQDWDNPQKTGIAFPYKRPPQEYDDNMQMTERKDPQNFRTENLSQWADVIDGYLDPLLVDRMFDDFEGRALTPQFSGKMMHTYRCHIDPSYTNANFAVTIAHAESIKEADGEAWWHVVVDWNKVWKPEDMGGKINYAKIEEELVEKFMHFPTLNVVSFDQYGSFVTVDQMKERLRVLKHKSHVRERKFTASSNAQMYERFSAALSMNWVHAYKDKFGEHDACLLEQELKFLQRGPTGKIDHPRVGPVRTDDLADTLLVCVDELLEDNFRRFATRKRLGETRLLSTAQGGYHTMSDDMSIARQRLGGSRVSARDQAAGRRGMRPTYSGMAHRWNKDKG